MDDLSRNVAQEVLALQLVQRMSLTGSSFSWGWAATIPVDLVSGMNPYYLWRAIYIVAIMTLRFGQSRSYYRNHDNTLYLDT